MGLVGLRLEEARWSGKMRKSPGQDDLHGEEEMDEKFQLIYPSRRHNLPPT